MAVKVQAPQTQSLSASELRARFGALAETLSGAVARDQFFFERDGRRFRVSWVPPSKNIPPGMRIGVAVDEPGEAFFGAVTASPERGVLVHPGQVVFRRESSLDRFGKRVRVNRELQTGDRAFDHEVYVESDASDADLSAIVGSPSLRQGVLVALQWARSITLEKQGFLTLHRFHLLPEDFTEESIKWATDTLSRMAGALPLLSPAPRRTRGAFQRWLVVGTVVGSIVAMVAIIVPALVWETTGHELQQTAARASLITWPAWAALCFFALRGRSTGLRDVILTLSLSLVGVPMGWVAGLYLLNCGLDSAQPATYEASIVDGRISRGKSTTYYVSVKSWRPGPESLTLRVTSGQYRAYRAAPGKVLAVVTTKPGRLGFEWLQSISIEPDDGP